MAHHNTRATRPHPAETLADQLDQAVKRWHDEFTPDELTMAATVRHRLAQIAAARPTPTGATPALTPREREIAGLLLDGVTTTTTIAARLGIATRTVDNTLSRIYTKLAITGRHELARHHLNTTTPAKPTRGPANNPRLTTRERQVAELAMRNLTDNTIGLRLGISPRTVGNTLVRIYTKLAITSRREITRHHLAPAARKH